MVPYNEYYIYKYVSHVQHVFMVLVTYLFNLIAQGTYYHGYTQAFRTVCSEDICNNISSIVSLLLWVLNLLHKVAAFFRKKYL